ncbi:MAG: cytochrome c [Solimonas sp.]
MKKQLTILAASLLLSGIASADQISDQIRIRQSAYSFIGWNSGRIKAQLDHPETYNKDQVVAAANAIAAVANSGLGALYGPGTDKGTGWKPTRLKSAFFEKQDEAAQIAKDFNKEANELARVAASGGAAEVKVQFAKLGETCKSCHNDFRERE